ncbi:MAG: DUF1566 domain-containing protein [Candidatus Scalindua sp.]
MTLSEREDGLTIIGVLPGNPGWDAGLRIGDIIPKIDGKEIKSLDDYLKIAEKLNKTKRLEASLTILREDVLYNVDIKRFNKAVRQSTIEKPPLTIQKKQRIEKPYSKTPRVKLRSTRSRSLSKDDVKDMLGRCNFYDSVWNKGGDFTNDYEAQVVNGDKVVIDHATGLMWHQSGSLQTMNWGETYYWIRELNRQKYAGYRNWRLPTIDEAVTLLESSKIGGENGLYIDSVFDSRQKLIWTSDEKAKTEKTWLGTSTSSGRYWWCVNFTSGTVSWLIKLIELNKHVRPVRTMR